MSGERVLVVDDDDVARRTITRLLKKNGYDVSSARNGRQALSLLARKVFQVVLTDLVMDDLSGMDVLEGAKKHCPTAEVILITGHASIASAVEAMRKGAYHYLEKPFRPTEVEHLIARAVEKQRLLRQVEDLKAELRDRGKGPVLIGRSPQITEVVRLLRQVAEADCNVLLTGESGTGKELAAALIHHHSRRAKGKFLALNCGGFTEELLANELFGHEEGAYTGATSSKAGLLEFASGGTVLLDEIGDTPLSMQVKLLRVVQEQEVIRVGGNSPIPIDIRVIAATNQDLKKAVDAGIFRKDLYYRLNVVSVRIPPLRERKEDVPPLVHYFIGRSAKKGALEVKGISEEAMRVLQDYDYPGNVRELENILEHAAAVAREEVIQVKDLPSDLSEMDVFSFDREDSGIKPLREVQRDYIEWVLSKVGRNRTKAAKLLGIDRASLWRHLRRYEIND